MQTNIITFGSYETADDRITTHNTRQPASGANSLSCSYCLCIFYLGLTI